MLHPAFDCILLHCIGLDCISLHHMGAITCITLHYIGNAVPHLANNITLDCITSNCNGLHHMHYIGTAVPHCICGLHYICHTLLIILHSIAKHCICRLHYIWNAVAHPANWPVIATHTLQSAGRQCPESKVVAASLHWSYKFYIAHTSLHCTIKSYIDYTNFTLYTQFYHDTILHCTIFNFTLHISVCTKNVQEI